MNDHAVEVVDLKVKYELGDEVVHALQGVSFTIASGEMVAIMGPSGCGKTTLLQQISGLASPDGGVVRVAGQPLSQWSPRQRAAFRRDHIGIVFQRFNLLPTLTAEENVGMAWRVAGKRPPRDELRHWLNEVGLLDRARHRPSQLSFGQQQRVAIARALAPRPNLLLLDEPTGSLDQKNGDSVMQLFVRFNQEMKITTLLVTHSPDAATHCGRALRMCDGRLEET